MQRKILRHIVIAALCVIGIGLSGCVSQRTQNQEDAVQVTCTTFAAYDFTKNLISGVPEIDVTLIAANGADLHSYQPMASDMVKIAESDLVITVGGISDAWADKAASQSGQAVKTVSLLELADRKTFPHDDEDHDHDHAAVSDEHVWLSPANAIAICEGLTALFVELTPEYTELLHENSSRYMEDLRALDKDFRETVENARTKKVVFADRYPFGYLADDYGLDCYAAFPGCSAETDAGFEKILSLAKVAVGADLTALAVTESADGKVAEAVIASMKSIAGEKAVGDVKIIAVDSMQTVTEKEVADGAAYLAIMRENLAAFAELLA